MIPSQLLLVTALMMAVLGAPLALLGTVVRRRVKGFNRRAQPVWGRVVHCESRLSTSGAFDRRMYIPLVEFATPQGQMVRAKGLGHREPVPLGTPVELLYDPQQPSEVSFTGPRGRAGFASALWLVGWLLVLGAAAVVALVFLA